MPDIFLTDSGVVDYTENQQSTVTRTFKPIARYGNITVYEEQALSQEQLKLSDNWEC